MVVLANREYSFGPEIVESDKVIPLNTNFYNELTRRGGRTRNGTVWVLTKEADGFAYYKGVRVNTLSSEFYRNHG